MEILNEQFKCEVCGMYFDLEEEREIGVCGHCTGSNFEEEDL